MTEPVHIFKKNALVIGGTGMLREVSLYLAKKDYVCAVVARSEETLKELVKKQDGIKAIKSDYTKSESFKHSLRKNIEEHGSFKTVIAWIHGDYLKVLDNVIPLLNEENESLKIHLVLGSKAKALQAKAGLSHYPFVDSYIIQLGYKIDNGNKRWLSHKEISMGVIESIERLCDIQVGRLD